jgi:hypothetical protein
VGTLTAVAAHWISLMGVPIHSLATDVYISGILKFTQGTSIHLNLYVVPDMPLSLIPSSHFSHPNLLLV